MVGDAPGFGSLLPSLPGARPIENLERLHVGGSATVYRDEERRARSMRRARERLAVRAAEHRARHLAVALAKIRRGRSLCCELAQRFPFVTVVVIWTAR